MSDALIVILVVAIVGLAAVAVWALVTMYRRQRLQERFGPEYQREIERAGSRREAERALSERAERHAQLHITPLAPSRRSQFSSEWRSIQARFVDEPPAALGQADELVERVMAERGYPTGDFDQRTADLSVEHADVLDHYRRAHAVAEATERGRAGTEEQRQAMVHYRALFTALLEDTDERVGARTPRRH